MLRKRKIFSIPVILCLDILLMIAKGILYVTGGIMNLLAIICLIAGIVGITNDLYQFMIIPAFMSAFLLSPFGIQLVVILVTVNVEMLRDRIKEM